MPNGSPMKKHLLNRILENKYIKNWSWSMFLAVLLTLKNKMIKLKLKQRIMISNKIKFAIILDL